MTQKLYEDQKNLQTVSSGNFLAKGHHPQKSVSEGGGAWGNSPQNLSHSISAMESFVKYATSMGSPDLKQSFNPPIYSHASYPEPTISVPNPQNGARVPPSTHLDESKLLTPVGADQTPPGPFPGWYPPNYGMPFGFNPPMKCEPFWYQKQEPWGQQTEFVAHNIDEKPFIPKVPFGTDPRRDEPIEKIDTEDGTLKKMQAKYIYYGDGGPVNVPTSPGPWCCRQGLFPSGYIICFLLLSYFVSSSLL